MSATNLCFSCLQSGWSILKDLKGTDNFSMVYTIFCTSLKHVWVTINFNLFNDIDIILNKTCYQQEVKTWPYLTTIRCMQYVFEFSSFVWAQIPDCFFIHVSCSWRNAIDKWVNFGWDYFRHFQLKIARSHLKHLRTHPQVQNAPLGSLRLIDLCFNIPMLYP